MPQTPHDVAEAIAKLLEQPQGSRPARVVVGQSFGADVLNAQAEGVQTQLLAGLGLSFLAQPPSSSGRQVVSSWDRQRPVSTSLQTLTGVYLD